MYPYPASPGCGVVQNCGQDIAARGGRPHSQDPEPSVPRAAPSPGVASLVLTLEGGRSPR